MDSLFFTTLLFIFLTAFIGTILRSRGIDNCLRSFDGFHVTIEEKDGNLIWGKMFVYSTGLELEYTEPIIDTEGHLESSYIIYKQQFKNIHAIYRYYDELSDKNKKIREKTIKETHNPSHWKKAGRNLKNTVNTFRDALLQAIGVAIGQMKKNHPGAMILKTQEENIANMGKEFIGYVGTAFDPILEKYIGKKVVLEVTNGTQTIEYPGILREYSAEFLEVLNIKKAVENTFVIKTDSPQKLTGKLSACFQNGKIIIENEGDQPVFVKQIVTKSKIYELNIVAHPNTIADLPLHAENDTEDIKLIVELAKDMDIVVPRSHALIRHSSEGKPPRIELDILRTLPVNQ